MIWESVLVRAFRLMGGRTLSRLLEFELKKKRISALHFLRLSCIISV